MEIELNNVPLPLLSTTDSRMSLLLWGPPGCGKTVLAASAPRKKLLINFDPDGPSSLGGRDDIYLLDLSGERNSIVDKFNNDDPYNVGKLLADKEADISTVIVDSTTAYSQLAVEKGISITKGATLERPSPGAYGARNAITLRMITSLLRVTKKTNTNIIFTSHEDAPTTSDDGTVMHITLALGGKLCNQAALQISEVWHMSDNGKERKLMVRPGRMRKPMKTRMFDASKSFEFTLRYDQNNGPDGEHSIASFLAAWEKNNYSKLPIPS